MSHPTLNAGLSCFTYLFPMQPQVLKSLPWKSAFTSNKLFAAIKAKKKAKQEKPTERKDQSSGKMGHARER